MYYPNIYSSHVTNVTLKKNGREVKVKKTERVEPDAGKLPAWPGHTGSWAWWLSVSERVVDF